MLFFKEKSVKMLNFSFFVVKKKIFNIYGYQYDADSLLSMDFEPSVSSLLKRSIIFCCSSGDKSFLNVKKELKKIKNGKSQKDFLFFLHKIQRCLII